VTLQHPDYQEAPALSRTVEHTGALRALALADRAVTGATERIVGQLMLNTARESRGAGFIALDPAAEDSATFAFDQAILTGEPFTTSRDRGIMLGERLAANLGVALGDKVVYMMTDVSGEIVSGLARVTAVVRTGSPGVDAALCLLPIDAVRTLLGYAEDEATEVAVFVRDQRATDALAARLGAQAGPAVAAVPWHDIQKGLAAFIALKVGGARFMEALIAVLVAAGIFNTLFVSVMERMREFGILLAIGWSPGRLFGLLMLESTWLGLLGLVGAALVTALPYWYLATTGIDLSSLLGGNAMDVAGIAMPSTFRVGIYTNHLVFIAFAAFIATLASGLYPAWRAARVHPVETIRLV
jgi:ABC-type lipoprotein release transport system permease subunit